MVFNASLNLSTVQNGQPSRYIQCIKEADDASSASSALQRVQRVKQQQKRRRCRCLGSCRFHRIDGFAPRHHQAVTASTDWRTCTWPSSYGVQTGPSTSRDIAVPGSGDVAGAPAAPVSAEGRGVRTGFSDAVRQGPTTQSPLPTDWWRHARGLAHMACQRAPAPLTSKTVPGSGQWPVHQQRQ